MKGAPTVGTAIPLDTPTATVESTTTPLPPTSVPTSAPSATALVSNAAVASIVPARGAFFYVNQSGTGSLTPSLAAGSSAPTQIVDGKLTLPDGQVVAMLPQHLYTFFDGSLVPPAPGIPGYAVSTGIGGATPIRSGVLQQFDRGKKLTPGDPGWIVQGGVYVDNFWALFPDTDPDSQILIHTLPFTPGPGITHSVASYHDKNLLGVQPASAGCIRMAPGMMHQPDGFNVFTRWAKAMKKDYIVVPFTIGP